MRWPFPEREKVTTVNEGRAKELFKYFHQECEISAAISRGQYGSPPIKNATAILCNNLTAEYIARGTTT